MRIGLCDDSPGDQAAALEVLEKLGLQADVFGTGEPCRRLSGSSPTTWCCWTSRCRG